MDSDGWPGAKLAVAIGAPWEVRKFDQKDLQTDRNQAAMASISEPVPLPLNFSTAGSKVHASNVLNCKNEAILAIDGEGLFIHSVLIPF